MWQQPASASAPYTEVAGSDYRPPFALFETPFAHTKHFPSNHELLKDGSYDVGSCLLILVTEVIVEHCDCNIFLARLITQVIDY